MLIQEIRFEVRKGEEDLGTFTKTLQEGEQTQIRIGSDNRSDVRLPRGLASRMHAVCEIPPERNGALFVDFGGTPVSQVNGKDAPKCALNNGDVIGIGDIEIRVTFEPDVHRPVIERVHFRVERMGTGLATLILGSEEPATTHEVLLRVESPSTQFTLGSGADDHVSTELKGVLVRHAVCFFSEDGTEMYVSGHAGSTFLNAENVNSLAQPRSVESGSVIAIGEAWIHVTFNPAAEEEGDTEEASTPLEEMTREALIARVRELEAEVGYLRRVKSSINGYLTAVLENARTQALLAESVQALIRIPQADLEQFRTLLAKLPPELSI